MRKFSKKSYGRSKRYYGRKKKKRGYSNSKYYTVSRGGIRL